MIPKAKIFSKDITSCFWSQIYFFFVKGKMKNSRRLRLITLWCLEMETVSKFKTRWEERF